MCLKVCDYGLARELYEKYYESDDDRVPYKWLAPEALTDGKYSSKSDVVSSYNMVHQVKGSMEYWQITWIMHFLKMIKMSCFQNIPTCGYLSTPEYHRLPVHIPHTFMLKTLWSTLWKITTLPYPTLPYHTLR